MIPVLGVSVAGTVGAWAVLSVFALAVLLLVVRSLRLRVARPEIGK
ncbi:hypothetical protein [Amycolatopsis nigrescens]|nr:hypothetical protein [Amycolatopsis nigrescens]